MSTTNFNYINKRLNVKAFKITPHTRDPITWPQWLKNKIMDKGSSVKDYIYIENNYIHMCSSIADNKIVKNGYFIILDEKDRLEMKVHDKFNEDYEEVLIE